MAISVPEPIAIPTSATLRAGASLIPSPTKANLPFFWSLWISCAFSSGKTFAITSSIPICSAIACATPALSPVSMTVLRPRFFNLAIASWAVSLGTSCKAIKPFNWPSTDRKTTVFASFSSNSKRSWYSRGIARSAKSLALPSKTCLPLIIPVTPFPCKAWKFSTG